ncbi:MAG: threonine-phosphate decarboxylase [Lachnospiraceae bacterium]|nr:threonine-phosphate decarboxylase [Lachnospiraceae bacterium]
MKRVKCREAVHGGDRLGASVKSGKRPEELLDFSANINPLGMPRQVREAVLAGISEAQHYPDPFCRKLCKAIAEAEGRDPEEILCGNGGADLIYRLVYALKPGKALVTAPAFAEYEEALVQAGAEIRRWSLGESLAVREDILSAVTEDLDLIFLCNPNNPTGLLTGRELLTALADRAQALGVRVFLDECFLDFVPEQREYTLGDCLKRYPNLVILKSFTKLYAMPGLRLGYVMSADRELLAGMEKAGQPWAVSVPAQAAGLGALQAAGFRERTFCLIERERKRMKAELERLGFFVCDGRANYLCFRAPGEKNLCEKLLERGILLRSCANYRGLREEHYRAAVRTAEENEVFLGVLREIAGKENRSEADGT